MQVVIDIDETCWDWLRNGFPDEDDGEYAIKAIANGIPLPKSHGRLIDADKFHEVVENIPIKDTDKWFNWMQKTCNRLADAPTIIEANKEE